MESLRALTYSEKEFLHPFIFDGANTCYAPISDGVTGGLAAKKIIYISSRIIEHFNAPYNLQPVARKLLEENPQLLD
jgi:hypothetical protein